MGPAFDEGTTVGCLKGPEIEEDSAIGRREGSPLEEDTAVERSRRGVTTLKKEQNFFQTQRNISHLSNCIVFNSKHIRA